MENYCRGVHVLDTSIFDLVPFFQKDFREEQDQKGLRSVQAIVRKTRDESRKRGSEELVSPPPRFLLAKALDNKLVFSALS